HSSSSVAVNRSRAAGSSLVASTSSTRARRTSSLAIWVSDAVRAISVEAPAAHHCNGRASEKAGRIRESRNGVPAFGSGKRDGGLRIQDAFALPEPCFLPRKPRGCRLACSLHKGVLAAGP